MYKKFVILAALIGVMMMLSGCVRLSVDVTVKEDGKVDASVLYAMMSDYADESFLPSDDVIESITKSGWEYEDYSEDGYVGYTMNIKDRDLKELLEDVENTDSELGLNTDSFSISQDGSKIIVDAELLDSETAAQMSSYKSYFDMYGGYAKLVLHVPEEAITSNATSVSDDGKTLTWDLLDMPSGEKAHAEFKIPAKNLLPIVAVIVIAAFVIGICIVLFILKKNKKPVEAESESISDDNE